MRADRRPGAILLGPHVDDRDIEVADVADQVQGLFAAGRLVHLEAVPEHAANPESDQRLVVDHQAVEAGAQDGIRSFMGGLGTG